MAPAVAHGDAGLPFCSYRRRCKAAANILSSGMRHSPPRSTNPKCSFSDRRVDVDGDGPRTFCGRGWGYIRSSFICVPHCTADCELRIGYCPTFSTYGASALTVVCQTDNCYRMPGGLAHPYQNGYVYIAQENLSRLAISCGDALPRTPEDGVPTTEEIMHAVLETVRDVSARFGAT
uniref:Uncharacterized protein n=1 Tax=Mycena chlorophos TaxID=658473 RepID=A0ABQ0L912_MYCCL|nr:predicted protein [Mycena chlorophos]